MTIGTLAISIVRHIPNKNRTVILSFFAVYNGITRKFMLMHKLLPTGVQPGMHDNNAIWEHDFSIYNWIF